MTSVATESPGLAWRLKAPGVLQPPRRGERRVLLAGEAQILQRVAGEFVKSGGGSTQVITAVLDGNREGGTDSGESAGGELAKEALRIGADEVVLCLPDAPIREILALARSLTMAGLHASFLSAGLSKAVANLPGWVGGGGARHLCGYPRVTFSRLRRTAGGELIKRAVDILLASAALVVLMPVWALLIPVLLVVQGAPVFFRQERIGRNGRKFLMYKFRTMRPRDQWPPEEELAALNVRSGPMFKAADDPRVTWLGRWLRRLCVDETPQFMNVLRGDMSLVGARPPLPAEVAQYERWQLERLSGHVGITGLWQISKRDKLDFDDVVLLDFYYNRNSGVLMDLRILAGTFTAVLLGRTVC